MDTHGTEMMALQEQLAAKNAGLLQLSVKQINLTDQIRRAKLQSAVGSTVSGDLKATAERSECERSARRAKTTCQYEDASTTRFTEVFSALLTELDGFKNCCEVLNLENQYTPGQVAEAKELWERMADHKKQKLRQKLPIRVAG